MSAGLESTPTVKDAHSPAGQPFYAPRSFAEMPDCPFCRYGTPIDHGSHWLCIDCGAKMTSEQVKRKN